MTTPTTTMPPADRVRTGPEPSSPVLPGSAGAGADRAKSRIGVGPMAQQEPSLSTLPPTPEAWAGEDDARLIDFLVERYHRPLREELPRLQALAARGPADDEAHHRAARLLDDLASLLLEHIDEEEEALFPAILAGGSVVELAVAALDDHQVALRLFGELQAMCMSLAVASDPVRRALAHSLATLEREFVDHIAIETDVLWPRLQLRVRRASRRFVVDAAPEPAEPAEPDPVDRND